MTLDPATVRQRVADIQARNDKAPSRDRVHQRVFDIDYLTTTCLTLLDELAETAP